MSCRDFTNIDGDRLTGSFAPVSGPPCSIFCSFKPTGLTNDTLVLVGVSGDNNFNQYGLTIGSSGTAAFLTADGVGNSSLLTTSTYSANVWSNVLGVNASGSSWAVYLNGGGKGSGATPKTPSGMNTVRISGKLLGPNYFGGRIGIVAFFNTALTDDMAASLGAGGYAGEIPGLVAYYDFRGNSPELDRVGGNNLTVTGTTFVGDDGPSGQILKPARRKIFIGAAAAAPAFSSGPTITSTTTTSYNESATPDASCTWHIIAVKKGSTTPTAAQVIAGVDYGGVTVLAHVSKAITGADTQSISPTGARPVNDLHHALTNGGGNSAVASQTNSLLAAPTGLQYVSLLEPGGSWSADSLPFGRSPASVTGDVEIFPLVFPDGAHEAIECDSDGIPHYTPATPGDSSRRTIPHRSFDVDVDDYSDVAPVNFYINNQAPVGQDFDLAAPAGQPMSHDLIQHTTDVESDTRTVTLSSGSVPGLSVVASALVGTPTVPGQYALDFLVTDTPGDTDHMIGNITIGDVLIPNVIGLDSTTGGAQLTASGFTIAIIFAASASPANIILDQSPPALTPAPPGTLVTLTVSSGPVHPNLYGLTPAEAAAKAALTAFTIGTTTFENSQSLPGRVIRQDPPAFSHDPSTVINIVVGQQMHLARRHYRRRKTDRGKIDL